MLEWETTPAYSQNLRAKGMGIPGSRETRNTGHREQRAGGGMHGQPTEDSEAGNSGTTCCASSKAGNTGERAGTGEPQPPRETFWCSAVLVRYAMALLGLLRLRARVSCLGTGDMLCFDYCLCNKKRLLSLAQGRWKVAWPACSELLGKCFCLARVLLVPNLSTHGCALAGI